MARQTTTQQQTLRTPPESLVSAFLSQYFFMDAVVGTFMTPQEKLAAYEDMAEIFCMAGYDRLNDIYEVMESDLFAQTNSYDNFCYLSRTMQLMPDAFTSDERYIAAQKSNGFSYFRETFKNGFFTTQNAALTGLEQAAKHGNTYATAILSFFGYTGICLPLNEGRALHYAKRLGYWNDLFGILLQLHYADTNDKANTDTTMKNLLSVLVAALDNGSEKDMLAYIANYYGFAVADEWGDEPDDNVLIPNPLAETLEKRLGDSVLAGNVMNPTLLKVLRSPVLSSHAKQTLVASFKEGENLDALPLHIRRVTALAPVTRLNVTSRLNRKDEQMQILANLSTLDARGSGTYRPLLLVCRDPFVLGEYARIMQEVFTKYVTPCGVTERIDLSLPGNVSMLTGRDKSMVNLLNKLKDACPVLLFQNCQDLDDGQQEVLVNFLRVEHRKQFPTIYDNVTLDLSGMLPILFATSTPGKMLTRVCDVVTLKDVSADEMVAVLGQIMDAKKDLYQLESLEADAEAIAHLQAMTSMQASTLLDKAIAQYRLAHADACQDTVCRHTHASICLTLQLLNQAEKLQTQPTITRLI